LATEAVYRRAVRTAVSPRAREFIRGSGGRLFVWADGPCCWGTRLVKASTKPPHDADTFERFDAEGVEVYLRPASGRLPAELSVEVRGGRHRRAEALWDGCAYVL
jgi:hypothetical protein